MSTVTITLTDDDGRVNVSIDGMPAAGAQATRAQIFGEALRAAIRDLRPCLNGMGDRICPYCDSTCTERNGR